MIPPEPARVGTPSRQLPAPEYVIRVKGCLDPASFSDWFGAMRLSLDREHGETLLSGPVVDQAELYGLLARLRSLALPLLSVTRADQAEDARPSDAPEGLPGAALSDCNSQSDSAAG